jgi:uncharacterized protein (DUF1778 family)
MAPNQLSKLQVVVVRCGEGELDVIDRAAQALGKSRSSFIVDAALREANQIVLDQSSIHLDAEQFDQFMNYLDNPPPPNDALRRLMNTKAPWE